MIRCDMQRALDIIFSGFSLALLSPLFAAVILILRCSGEGYVLYFQKRIGKHEKPFKLIKFATMLKDSPKLGSGDITTAGDPRILPIGVYLRKTKINELPQLINVFKGDMSFVGPRPLTKKNFDYYSEEAKYKIAGIRPGLTGIGSLVFYNEESLIDGANDPIKFYAEQIAPFKEQLESWFLEKKSMFLYLKIIFLTALAVFGFRVDPWQAFDDLPKLPPKSKLKLF